MKQYARFHDTAYSDNVLRKIMRRHHVRGARMMAYGVLINRRNAK